jgi:hypothetical protein
MVNDPLVGSVRLRVRANDLLNLLHGIERVVLVRDFKCHSGTCSCCYTVSSIKFLVLHV